MASSRARFDRNPETDTMRRGRVRSQFYDKTLITKREIKAREMAQNGKGRLQGVVAALLALGAFKKRKELAKLVKFEDKLRYKTADAITQAGLYGAGAAGISALKDDRSLSRRVKNSTRNQIQSDAANPRTAERLAEGRKNQQLRKVKASNRWQSGVRRRAKRFGIAGAAVGGLASLKKDSKPSSSYGGLR